MSFKIIRCCQCLCPERCNHSVFITCCFLISSLIENPIAAQTITSLSICIYKLHGSFGAGTRYAKTTKENTLHLPKSCLEILKKMCYQWPYLHNGNCEKKESYVS